MPPAVFASTSALIGGVLWLIEWLTGSGTGPLGGTLHWGGLTFLLLAVAVAAGCLVTGEVVVVRLIATAAAPLLAWSVFEFFRPAESGWYVAGWGLVAVAVAAHALWRDRSWIAPAPRASRGAHAR